MNILTRKQSITINDYTVYAYNSSSKLFSKGLKKIYRVLQRMAHPQRLLSASGCYNDPALFTDKYSCSVKIDVIYLAGNVRGREIKKKGYANGLLMLE